MLRNIFFIFFISFYGFTSSINSHGVVGYINTPSAYLLKESTIAFGFHRNIPDRKWLLTASPFNWLDAGIFYADVTNTNYGVDFFQSYKDKGFNFKAGLIDSKNITLSLGVNDVAGTGLYSSEYVVASKQFDKFELSIGLGWGEFSNGYEVKNPLIYINNKFQNRSNEKNKLGGDFDTDNYFSGPASIFFGSSYKINKKIKLLLEKDPTNLISFIPYPEKKTSINLGVDYSLKNFSVRTMLIRGSEVAVQFSYIENFLDYKKNNITKKNNLIDSFNQLQDSLENHHIGLKSVKSDDKSLFINIRQTAYPNQSEAYKIARHYANKLTNINHDEVIISQYLHGMKVASSSWMNNLNPSTLNETIETAKEGKKNLYIVKENYPYFFNSVTPRLRNFIASREGFYYGGLFLEDDFEIVLREKLFFLGNLKISLYDQFDNLFIPPVNTYPEQVRSDIKKYYQNFGDGITIGRLELNYFESINKKHFFRLSAGIFEEMYAGAGFEHLYHPEGSLFSFGIETFFVKKRDYDMKFGFQDYSNILSRVNAQFKEPLSKTKFKLSFGEYLAGDTGYTFEASRRFRNGIEFSAFFTKTDVSPELYGEGSFDKGIKVKIPMIFFDIKKLRFTKQMNSLEWRPLTKDPGALLIKSIDLEDEIDRFRIY